MLNELAVKLFGETAFIVRWQQMGLYFVAVALRIDNELQLQTIASCDDAITAGARLIVELNTLLKDKSTPELDCLVDEVFKGKAKIDYATTTHNQHLLRVIDKATNLKLVEAASVNKYTARANLKYRILKIKEIMCPN